MKFSVYELKFSHAGYREGRVTKPESWIGTIAFCGKPELNLNRVTVNKHYDRVSSLEAPSSVSSNPDLYTLSTRMDASILIIAIRPLLSICYPIASQSILTVFCHSPSFLAPLSQRAGHEVMQMLHRILTFLKKNGQDQPRDKVVCLNQNEKNQSRGESERVTLFNKVGAVG
jgi:hypothetical protein